MKKILTLSVSVTFLLLNTSCNPDSTTVGDQNLITSTDTSGLLVCKLVGPEFQKRKTELQAEIFSKVESVNEVPDGFIFHFKDEGDFLQKLADLMLAEQKCCPFFQFDLSVKSYNQGIDWKISGTPEVKEMLRSMVN